MSTQQKKAQYGITMAPIPCTEAWRRSMPFDHNSKGVVTYSFILVNRYTGTRTHVNTYDGHTGPGYDATRSTYPIKKWNHTPGEAQPPAALKNLEKDLKIGKDNAYSKCLIADCPVAVLASPPDNWVGDPIVEPPLY